MVSYYNCSSKPQNFFANVSNSIIFSSAFAPSIVSNTVHRSWDVKIFSGAHNSVDTVIFDKSEEKEKLVSVVDTKKNEENVIAKAKNTKSSNNRKKNDPKPYKKNGKPRGKTGLKSKKKVPILPLTDLKLGSKIEGRVSAFTDFGVFIKINYKLHNKGGRGGYALLHKSQIRDETVEDPKKLFRIGALIKNLRVIRIDYERGEVSLSLREQRDDRKPLSKFFVGQEYEGKVSRIVNYGAFIDVGAKTNALLHISRISQKKIKNIRNWMNEGDMVKVRLISINENGDTMAASMLDVEADDYLNRRSAQLKRMRERSHSKNAKMAEKGELKSELEYFEDAVKELEDAL